MSYKVASEWKNKVGVSNKVASDGSTRWVFLIKWPVSGSTRWVFLIMWPVSGCTRRASHKVASLWKHKMGVSNEDRKSTRLNPSHI